MVCLKIYPATKIKLLKFISFFVLLLFVTGSSFAITEKELREIANDLNRDVPTMIDRDTQLYSVQGGPGLQLTYYNKLIHYSSTVFSSSQKAKLKKEQDISIKKRFCSNPDIRYYFFKNKVHIRCYYEWADGVFFTEVFVYPSDCGF